MIHKILNTIEDNTPKIIKVSSKGLVSKDKEEFEKRSSGVFNDVNFKELASPGEVLIHLVALGATEFYGPNKWGDGFSVETCKKYHPCFVKYAKFYRHHENKDPNKSYGIVKKSAYNDKMGRVELIVALNATEEAARRNKGLVADKELDKLENGEPIPVSMSCLAEADICSGCGHYAKKEAEYCDDKICQFGGLKKNKGKTFSDGFTLYADTQAPLFFDISHVRVPADRIAYTLVKLAHKEKQSYDLPSYVYYYKAKEKDINNVLDSRVNILKELKNIEEKVNSHEKIAKVALFDYAFLNYKGIKDLEKELLLKYDIDDLTANKILVPLDIFNEKYTKFENVNLKKVANWLYSNISENPQIYELLVDNPFEVKKQSNLNLKNKFLVYNMSNEGLKKKAELNLLKNNEINYNYEVSDNNFNEEEMKLSVLYGLYQISFVEKNNIPLELIISYNKWNSRII